MPPAGELAFSSLTELAALIRKKKLSPVELTATMLKRIGQLNPQLNAYLTVCEESAREQAREAEREISRGRVRGPLHGMPIALKDNIYTRGVRTTAGSKVLADFVPATDATVARQLAGAGAIMLGKTNLHEFAYGVTTTNEHFGAARNPWNLECIPGGSSGGSAAAIAAGMCCAAMGSDTGGSIRIPASLCGVVGLKPTFGRVSVHGIVPLSPSLDHAGPLGRTVEDVAEMFTVIAGRDPLDPTTMFQPDLRNVMPHVPARSLRIGWPREYFFENVDAEVVRAVEAVAATYQRLGATVEDVTLAHIHANTDASTHIAIAEARAYHQQAGYFPARAGDYSEDVRKRLEMGADVKAVDFLEAQRVQRIVRREFEEVLERVDAIIAPATPVAAPRIGEKVLKIGEHEEPIRGEPAQGEPVRGALLRLNRPANFTGLPSVALPCGFTKEGLPIGFQLMGRAWDEMRLLGIAQLYEQAHEWWKRAPKL